MTALTIAARHQRRTFGANGFYGNSPSKEWTDQTLASLKWTRPGERWTSTARLAGRNHGDHFRWDINRPGFAEKSTTRSPRQTASRTLCVTKTIVFRRSCQIDCRSP